MVKIPSPRRLFRSRSRSTAGSSAGADICAMVAEHEKIEWEVRPGGMLVQKRRTPEEDAAAVEYILVRVVTGWQWHDVSIDATATFGTFRRPPFPALPTCRFLQMETVALVAKLPVAPHPMQAT